MYVVYVLSGYSLIEALYDISYLKKNLKYIRGIMLVIQ